MIQRKRCPWCYGFCHELRPHISTYPVSKDRCPNCRETQFELVEVDPADLPSEPVPVVAAGKQKALFD